MHCLAASRLFAGDDAVAGQVFFAIDRTKVCNFLTFFEPYVAAKGYRVPVMYIPRPLAWLLASIAEDVFWALKWLAPNLLKGKSLLFTRRAIHGTCVTQWFDTDKAYRILGYQPLVNPREAQRRTIDYFATRNEFAQGPFVYGAGQFDYFDDEEFRPTSELYLEGKKTYKKNEWRVWCLAVGCASLVLSHRI